MHNADSKTRTPLYGHTSQETAYLVSDYPYGRTARCRIRYWLEKDEKRGFRFVSQTEEPRHKVWNKPKASTYSRFAGAMYLDETGRVQWTGLSEYSNEADALAFVRDFPGADLSLLRPFAALRAAMYRKVADSGKAMFAINGKRDDLSPDDVQRYRDDADKWASIARTQSSPAEA